VSTVAVAVGADVEVALASSHCRRPPKGMCCTTTRFKSTSACEHANELIPWA
jgi:hypothetical protein